MKYAVVIKGSRIEPQVGVDLSSVYDTLEEAQSGLRSRQTRSNMFAKFSPTFDVEWEIIPVKLTTLNEYGRTGYLPAAPEEVH